LKKSQKVKGKFSNNERGARAWGGGEEGHVWLGSDRLDPPSRGDIKYPYFSLKALNVKMKGELWCSKRIE